MITNNNPFGVSGYRFQEVPPTQTYKTEARYKKHRKKKRFQPRIKVLSGYTSSIAKGEFMIDNEGGVIYYNQADRERVMNLTQSAELREGL